MMFLADTSDPYEKVEKELGLPVGQLITPLTGYRNHGRTWALDNGGFSRFEAARFRAILKRDEAHKARCLFVAAPDVVGSARRTLEVFDFWRDEIRLWPTALVAQDGIEDLEIPWDRLQAVFIGGTDRFKESASALHVARAARILGKHVHVGRVNTALRLDRWEEEADTFDGTGVARFSHMREKMRAPLLCDGMDTPAS